MSLAGFAGWHQVRVPRQSIFTSRKRPHWECNEREDERGGKRGRDRDGCDENLPMFNEVEM
jgi:hypothetical protein